MTSFPPLETAHPTGMLAMGGDLEVETLKLAYRSGIFPWPHEGYPLLWFAPPRRAILEFKEFHVPKRLQQYLKTAPFRFRVDGDFEAVIRACAATPRKGQPGTWITDEMIDAYTAFHQAGYAHSFETLNQAGELVGGLYGVKIGHMFCGESMFHRVDHASKFAFIKTVDYLINQGSSWMDVQILTPLLARFGAKEVDRPVFMKMLKKAITSDN